MQRPTPPLGEEALGDREPDAVGEALPQRAGGGLDPRGVAALGVPGRAGAPLAELLQVVEGDVVAAQVERRVLEDAGVTGGEDEPVAARPVWIRRIVSIVSRAGSVARTR